MAAFHMAFDLPWFSVDLVLGCVIVAEALGIQTFGVDLTRESADIRGIRRRSIPWLQAQGVLRHEQFGEGG
jgi:hypothetical protein